MMKNKYETVFVLSTKKFDDEALTATTEKFKSLIEANEGSVETVDVWGKRRLAYPINYETEGYYVLISFEAPATLPLELSRVYNITDGVLRSIVIRK